MTSAIIGEINLSQLSMLPRIRKVLNLDSVFRPASTPTTFHQYRYPGTRSMVVGSFETPMFRLDYQMKLTQMKERLREEARAGRSEVQVAPLRSLDDFVLASSRFQLPEPNSDPVKRVANNLIYYQSNYFLGVFLWSLLALAYHHYQCLVALLILFLVHLLSLYAKYSHPSFFSLQRDQPGAVALATFLVGSFMAMLCTTFGVYVVSILVPTLAVLTHSFLRLRNMKNKMTNVAESLGFSKRTPMGLILEEFGIEHNVKLS